MKIYVATVIACWAALMTQAAAEPEWFWKETPVPASELASTPAPTPAPTKQIQLDYDIVPTWDQLGTKPKTKKIRLWRVYSFWSALEARDKKAVRSLYTTTSEDAAAVTMIDDYYDGAKKCLRKQKETQRKTRAEIEAALAEIKSCIASTVAPPTFTILASQSLPSDFYEPVVVDYSDEAAEEEEGGEEMVADTPAITPTAVVMPTVVEVEPTNPVVMPTGTESFDPHYTGPATGTESNTEPMTGTEPFDPHYTGPATGTESNTEPGTGTEPFDPHYTGPATGTESNTSPFEGTTMSGAVTTETETGPSSESLTMQEPTKPAEPGMIGTEYHGPIETPNPTFVETHAEETIQPEPMEPVVIQAPETYVEPVQEPEANTETVQPEPIMPVEIETTTPEFVEPTDPPGTDVSTTEPPVEYPGGTLAPGDEPYIKQEINPPEKPEPFEHVLPPVVPTDEPVILTETNAPEKPEPFEHYLPNVGPTEGPVIISEINPPELNPKEANDIKPPHVEVEYENTNGETTAPQDYNPAGETTYIVPTMEPEVVYETINPETEEPQPPVAVVYSDPSGETTEPEPYHPSSEHVEDVTKTETETLTPLIAPVPDSITEPPENVRPDVVAPDPASWPFSPVSPAVPPMWALDIDRSDSVDFDEWLAYLKKLRTIASDAVVAGRDEEAVVLLQTIVDYHYSAFGKCIIRMLKKEGGPMVDAAAFPIVAKMIEDGCNVKFRYSLFAGPPPFEWVAKEKPTVTAKDVEAWFAKRVEQARKDVESKKIVHLSHREHEMIQRVIACTHAQLDANGDAPIHRDVFYAALRKIDECAAE